MISCPFVTKSNLMNCNPLPSLQSCNLFPNYCFCFALSLISSICILIYKPNSQLYHVDLLFIRKHTFRNRRQSHNLIKIHSTNTPNVNKMVLCVNVSKLHWWTASDNKNYSRILAELDNVVESNQTLYFSGTIHSHIPTVSATISCPRGKTSGWLKAWLNTNDFPVLYLPAMDTTHTGSIGGQNDGERYVNLCW